MYACYPKLDEDAIKRQLLVAAYRVLPDVPFQVVDVSPENYPELLSTRTYTLPILGRYCETSIFGEPYGNVLQRVLHDTVHMAIYATTSQRDELRVATEQCRIIENACGRLSADVVFADLAGQTEHIIKYGVFPTEQAAFTFNLLRTGRIDRF